VILLLVAAFPGAAHGQTVYIETFDAVVAPDLPGGWSAGDGWATSTSSASTGSGLNNLAHTGMSVSEATLPPVDLSGISSATLSFLARRTSSYPLEGLRVTASLDGGASWPIEIMPVGAALPGTASAWEAVEASVPGALIGQSGVLVRFEVSGGTTSGANLRLDDIRIAAGGGGSTGGGSSLGFSSGSSSALSPATGFNVALRLDYDATVGLGALQLRVSWDNDLLTWSGVVPGAAVSDPAQWTVSAEPGLSSATILIVSHAAASLPAGTYDPIVELRFDVGPLAGGVPEDVTLALSDVIGAQAVPTGDDAGIGTSTSTHLVTVTQAAPIFEAPASVDLGIAAIGQTISGTLTVTNAAGGSELVIGGVAADHPSFGVSPTSATVPAGGTFDFLLTYTPDGSALGAESAQLSFTHDGSNGPVSVVSVHAQAGAGRGDANGDAMVDLLDFLIGIDVALGRIVPSAGVVGALDLYPFASGDGSVDVRDLTVLAHAIVQNTWPDGEPLPDPGSGGTAGKVGGFAGRADAILALAETSSGLEIRVRTSVPLKGLQFDLLVPGTVSEWEVGDAAQVAPLYVGQAEGRVRFLWARLDGGLIPEGEAVLAVLREIPRQAVSLGRSIVVDQQQVVTSASLEAGPELPESGRLRLGAPFPNPYPMSVQGALNIPVQAAAGSVEVRILDLLGRVIRRIEVAAAGPGSVVHAVWKPTDSNGLPLAPGLYFVTAAGADGTDVRPIVVTR
jgi:hypothetical protein